MRSLHAIAAVVALGGWIVSSAPAAPPDTITFQGRLTEADGDPVSGTVNLTFSLYDGVGQVWTETQSVTVSDGAYCVQLGDVSSLATLPFDDAYTLGIAVEGDSEMAPRLALGASPYAFRARYADSVTDGVVTTGSYANPAWITSLAGSKITGNISGNAANVTGVVAIANGGTGSSTQNFVDLSTAQTIAGVKTFSSTISGNISGNAGTVTNGVYTSGSYANPAWITSLAGSKITGNISGNAANVTGVVAIANGGTGSSTQNFVDLSTAQTIGGAKTFTTTQTLSLSSNVTGLVIKGSGSQSANLMEFRNASNTLLAYIDANGNFEQTGNITAYADNAMSLGTDYIRWQSAYFGPGSVHVIAKKGELELPEDREWTIGVQVKGHPAPGSFRLMERVGGTDAMSVTPDGRVGIGTMAPASGKNDRLDVRGNIKMGTAGELFAVGGTENLRTLRGQVDSKGIPVVGVGYKVDVLGQGTYRIIYDVPFSDPAVPAVNPIGREANEFCAAMVLALDRGYFVVQTFVRGTPGDLAFTFVVVGAN